MVNVTGFNLFFSCSTLNCVMSSNITRRVGRALLHRLGCWDVNKIKIGSKRGKDREVCFHSQNVMLWRGFWQCDSVSSANQPIHGKVCMCMYYISTTVHVLALVRW